MGTLSDTARRHLWMHFTRMSDDHDVPVIVRGEGAWVYDDRGKRYLDGLAGLFVSQVGHGRTELADAMAKQASELAYFPVWSYAHPRAIELAERLADLAPGDLDRVFFTTGGSEAVESAWKLARQYFQTIGQPRRYKVLSRYIAYHGTTMGALSLTGVPAIKAPYEPLVPGAIKVPNTNPYRPAHRPGRGHRARDRDGRAGDGRGRVPGTGAELGRVLPAAARLLPASARDLRRVRRFARVRRGDLRLRATRPLVRLRALRVPARHHHDGQRLDVGVLARRRHDRPARISWSRS